MRWNELRNRKIFDAFENGESIVQLAKAHGLSENRIRAILIEEKNKRALSLDPYYRRLRVQG